MNQREITSMEAHDILREVLAHGDHKALQRLMHISPTLLYGWTILPKRDGGEGELNPIERFCTLVEILRTLGNSRAEELVQYVNDRLGYVCYRPDPDSMNDEHMARWTREISEVFEARAHAEKDGEWTAAELDTYARELSDVAQQSAAFAAYVAKRAAELRASEKRTTLRAPRPFIRMNR